MRPHVLRQIDKHLFYC